MSAASVTWEAIEAGLLVDGCKGPTINHFFIGIQSKQSRMADSSEIIL